MDRRLTHLLEHYVQTDDDRGVADCLVEAVIKSCSEEIDQAISSVNRDQRPGFSNGLQKSSENRWRKTGMADNLEQQKAQLQAGMAGGPSGSQISAEEAAKRNSEQEVMKNSILTQVLNQDARARLNNLAAVKPEKAKAVENMIIQMARMGHIREKLSDERFRQLLDQIAEKTTKATTVKFDRRRAAIDSDSD